MQEIFVRQQGYFATPEQDQPFPCGNWQPHALKAFKVYLKYFCFADENVT